MLDLSKQFPVEPNPTWTVLDSSKISDSNKCWRYFFLRHILGFDSKSPKQDLVFGEAIHRGMEAILEWKRKNEGMPYPLHPHLGEYAYVLFEEVYRKSFDPDTDDIYEPKSPLRAQAMFPAYLSFWREADINLKVHFTEVCGTVPVSSDGDVLHFRIDGIIERDGKVGVMDHKTSKVNRASWELQWQINVQIGTYLHALYCFYEPKDVSGFVVNGLFFHKNDFAFIRPEIHKSPEMQMVWLNSVQDFLFNFERHMETFRTEDSPSHPYMKAFPLTPGAYFTCPSCPFFSFCASRANPLACMQALEQTYNREFWDPRDLEKTAKKVVHL